MVLYLIPLLLKIVTRRCRKLGLKDRTRSYRNSSKEIKVLGIHYKIVMTYQLIFHFI